MSTAVLSTLLLLGAWEVIDEDLGIKVLRKDMPGSKLVAFRGEGVVASKIGKIVTIFFDEERSKEWVALLADSAVLEQHLEQNKYEQVVWQHYDQPWPVSDRDFVYGAKGEADPAKKTFTIRYKSVERKEVGEQDCCVRGEMMDTFFRFTARPDGTTFVECEVFLDPRGMLPAWAVNLVQKGWPQETIVGIRKQVAKKNIVEAPGFEGWH